MFKMNFDTKSLADRYSISENNFIAIRYFNKENKGKRKLIDLDFVVISQNKK
jgi:hypothetical protein